MNKQTLGMIEQLAGVGISAADARQLRRISMTLHRWHELECGDGNGHGSWCIVRGQAPKREFYRNLKTQAPKWHTIGEFTYSDDGAPFIEHHHYQHGHGSDYVTHTRIADREAGAKRRLSRIMANYAKLRAYVQTDPRGCALYILPEGVDAENYNRGIAVHK